ncbi:acylphosphatase [Syntrophus gentianae]|uniref:Acylphosphatase n=1 Tax=Syntrophus gentianae TaxID=43775 RepID=A0A1H7XEP8_9BACT|nr:acylphosphatase [Syntrophus gentianae]SEM32135.1 acylphosphatase [Syntrophus gentianae]
MKRVRVFVQGRVQGVFFRAHTHRAALGFHLHGWVRNLPDGRVEALFEGKQHDVEAMVDWCRRGPSHAVVEQLTVLDEPYSGEFADFIIRYE